MRVAIYARVSTDDKGQDPENQLRELRAWCSNSGPQSSRSTLTAAAAERRRQATAIRRTPGRCCQEEVRLRVVLGAGPLQPGRYGADDSSSAAPHLLRRGIYSYTEPHFSTDNELVRNVLLALLSSLAKLEAQKISERTRAGMARAKAKGIKIGRSKLGIEIRQKIAQRAKKGETPYAIAKALGIDRHTAAKYAHLRA